MSFFKAHGVRLVLATNGTSEQQRSKIERFKLEEYFDGILVEGELGFGKPETAVYEKALEILDASPAEVWSVGDNLEWDVFAPQRLGITGVWHDYERRGFASNLGECPDRIIHDVSELSADR